MLRRILLGAYLSVVMGCDGSESTDPVPYVRAFDQDLVAPTAGKWDTGSLSILATDLEGAFE